jgi:hypothetical protein
VLGQRVIPDILIISGQELESVDQQLLQREADFSIIVEDDVGAAASLSCPRLTKMKPEEFPKVIIVHGNFSSSPSASCAAPFSFLSPAAFLSRAGFLNCTSAFSTAPQLSQLRLSFLNCTSAFSTAPQLSQLHLSFLNCTSAFSTAPQLSQLHLSFLDVTSSYSAAGAPCVISVCSAPPSLLEGDVGGGSDKDRALFFTRRVACSIVAQLFAMQLNDSIDSCVQRVQPTCSLCPSLFHRHRFLNREQAFDVALHQWEEKPKNLSVVSQVIPRLSSAHLFNSISVEKYTGPHARDDLNSC